MLFSRIYSTLEYFKVVCEVAIFKMSQFTLFDGKAITLEEVI